MTGLVYRTKSTRRYIERYTSLYNSLSIATFFSIKKYNRTCYSTIFMHFDRFNFMRDVIKIYIHRVRVFHLTKTTFCYYCLLQTLNHLTIILFAVNSVVTILNTTNAEYTTQTNFFSVSYRFLDFHLSDVAKRLIY